MESTLEKLYEQQGNWSRLAELLVRQADGVSHPEEKAKLLSRAAKLYSERLEESSTAASLLQRASELRPDDRSLLLQLCDVLNASGRSREAAETLQRIVESYGGRRSKELGEIHRRLAAAYRAQGSTQDALRELDQVAYVRFASVYRHFREATDFHEVLDEIAGKVAAPQPTPQNDAGTEPAPALAAGRKH